MPKHLIVDLETKGKQLSVDEAEIAVFGAYDPDNKKFYIWRWNDNVKALAEKLMKESEFIITFNGQNFDFPILERHGIDTMYMRHIDVYKIFLRRQTLIQYRGFKSLKMKNLIKYIGISDESGLKGEIDYKLFNKPTWTPEEQREIAAYVKQDLVLTAKMWEYLKNKFAVLAEWINEQDAYNYKHVVASPGSYVYKAICNATGLLEEYDSEAEPQKFPGAFVLQPSVDAARGLIVLFDFASLYPTVMVQINRYSENCSCCKPDEKWTGGGFFKTNGAYCSKKQGKIEEFLKAKYLERKAAKQRGDKDREYGLKILLNTAYGAGGSPKFKSIYSLAGASDVTGVSEQCIKYAIKRFNELGLPVLYTDTDSCYVQVPKGVSDVDNDGDFMYAKNAAKLITDELRAQFNFPWEEFNFKYEDSIKYIQFFKNKDGTYAKKHYLYVDSNDKVVIKGLPLVMKNCSDLAIKIFNERIKPSIVEHHECKFPRLQLMKWIEYEVNQDMSLIAKQFNVKDGSTYKSTSSLQYQIFKTYGEGEHKLIKNVKIGAGKGVKYCMIEEAKQLNLADIDYTTVESELECFIE